MRLVRLASCASRVCLSVCRLSSVSRLSVVCRLSSRVLCVSRLVRLASVCLSVVCRLVRLASVCLSVVSRLVRLASVCLSVVSRLSRVGRLVSRLSPCECLRELAHFMRRSSFKEFNASELISLKMSTRHIIPLLFI